MFDVNGKKPDCSLEDEMVSYLFGEGDAATRDKFEVHLATCDACTDEFAGIANARFAVTEWRQEEFAHIVMPEISVPYAVASRPVVNLASEKSGLLAGIRDLIAIRQWSGFSKAFGAVVVILGAAVIGFVVFYSNAGSNDIAVAPEPRAEIANNNSNNSSKDFVAPGSVTADQRSADAARVDEARVDGATGDDSPAKITTAGRKNSRPLDSHLRRDSQAARYNKNVNKLPVKAPALSGLEESEDESLRLAALFDQIDTF